MFAVSLLERPPPFAASSTVLGWLPAEGGGVEDGVEDGGEGEGGVGLNDFTENREWFLIFAEYPLWCSVHGGFSLRCGCKMKERS